MSPNLQPLMYIGIPSILILTGIFFNWSAAKDIRSEMNTRFAGVDKKLDDIKDAGHRDALEIMRQMTALHERVAIVETKQAR